MNRQMLDFRHITTVSAIWIDEPYTYARRPSGEGRYHRFMFEGVDADGKTWQESRRMAFRTLTDARAHVRHLKTDLERGHAAVASKTTVGDWLDEWLAGCLSGVSPQTRQGYDTIVRCHLKPALGSIPLDALDAATVNRFYRAQESRMAARTVLHQHTCLHRALRDAVAHERVSTSVFEREAARIQPPTVQPGTRNWLGGSEIAGLLDDVAGEDWLETAVVLAVVQGLRVGEVCGLQWGDVDFDNGVLRVRRSVESTKAGLRVKTPKTKAGTRTVPLMRQAASALLAWRDSLDAAPQSQGWVIPSGTAEPMAPGRVSSRWQTWSKRKENAAKYGPLRFHDLRHSVASFWLVSGVSLFEVSRWLGHSTIQVTADTYGHLLVDSAAGDRASDRLDSVLAARAKAGKTAAKRAHKSA